LGNKGIVTVVERVGRWDIWRCTEKIHVLRASVRTVSHDVKTFAVVRGVSVYFLDVDRIEALGRVVDVAWGEV